jgi:hypothetical protein
MCKEMSLTKKQRSKFRLRWKGPYQIIKRLSDLTYLIKINSSTKKVINVNRMKICKSRAEPLRQPIQGTRIKRMKKPTVREATLVLTQPLEL